jgi:hypothetical protein
MSTLVKWIRNFYFKNSVEEVNYLIVAKYSYYCPFKSSAGDHLMEMLFISWWVRLIKAILLVVLTV